MVASPFASQPDNSAVLFDRDRQQWYRFQQPRHLLSATRLADVLPVLEEVSQRVTAEQLYGVGFVTYEAAPAFDPILVVQSGNSEELPFPLVWFGLYAAPTPLTLPPFQPVDVAWTPQLSAVDYQAAIRKTKDYIKAGVTYQVNYSFRLQASLASDPWHLFLQMVQAQGKGYGAFVQTPDWAICSASPELFFERTDQTLVSRPMKGTVSRGRWYGEDRQRAEWLHHSEKNRAENVMIVDMVRNDMAQIAETGTVDVPRLFDLEQYPTLWQMTSTVQCRTKASIPAIFRALFPAASITGAPKARTMKIIAELEASPRRIYTGSIGLMRPDGRSQFNVAIRTVLVDRQRQRAEYGVGGGILWDSQEQAELEECQTKARVLTQVKPTFSLLETMAWSPETGYFLLEKHLQRLRQSAGYFGFPISISTIHQRLEILALQLARQPHRVRLLLSEDGGIWLEHTPHTETLEPLRVALAPSPVDSSDPFLYHKTTHRQVYEQARSHHPDQDDVLLWNERGELTEACLGNIVVEQDSEFYTPPIDCGLLAGTYRAFLLEQGKLRERVVLVQDLHQYSGIYVINSVRKMQQARIST
ncbi:MAG: aminodeoxychorismate synthase component I [Synechococcales bacterium]|nr:aminodeoxychorismate synthase component I [Synechococcales bacterium]